ncbi:MAG: histidine kinase [Clostridia bacterium]|nr:histidine kinase [Clostridia bacterium]
MTNNAVFNAAVCIMGILILSIHVVNLLLKKEKRKDEKSLLDFFLFTVIHFATYLTFTLVKIVYTSNAYIIGFYTAFYIMNNIEVFMLFKYMRRYLSFPSEKEKYYSLLNLALFSLFVILDVVNIFTGIFFTAESGVYLRSRTMILSQGYQFVIFLLVFVLTLRNNKLNVREKTAFALYCFLPLIAIILQNVFKGYAIAYASIIVAIEVLFFFVNIQKNIDLAKEEEKNKETQIKLMLSQIKPHFIYNSLSAISTLIPLDPEKAQKALDDFTEYLRHNLASLTETRLIPFENELRHIETYVSLEKLRFGNRINAVFDVQVTDFLVPPLAIQPIVENAIKHGILKKLEGGTLILKTYETECAFVVEVADDGVGFDFENVDRDKRDHFGINNIKYRIEKACNGEISVRSEIGKGTSVTVVFHKERI